MPFFLFPCLMEQAAHQEKSHAALSSVLWSAFLTVIKLWAGIVTGSLGIISEALHSGLDLMAAAMTFYAVKVASRPADESHPYGHEKVENLSALAETALLLVTCAWIVWEAVDRLFYNEAEITLTWWAFAVVAVSLLVDVNRSAMLRRIAKKHKSQALEADALHFTTDIWSSAVVLLGLFCIWLAHLVPAESAWHGLLERADAIAALFVAALVCSVAFGHLQAQHVRVTVHHQAAQAVGISVQHAVRISGFIQAQNFPAQLHGAFQCGIQIPFGKSVLPVVHHAQGRAAGLIPESGAEQFAVLVIDVYQATRRYFPAYGAEHAGEHGRIVCEILQLHPGLEPLLAPFRSLVGKKVLFGSRARTARLGTAVPVNGPGTGITGIAEIVHEMLERRVGSAA